MSGIVLCVYASIDGRVSKILSPGRQVEAKDLPIAITPQP